MKREDTARRTLIIRSNLRCRRGTPLPYRRRRSLLSRGEKAFYDVLREAVGGRFAIAIKPRLADVLHCPRTQWHSAAGARVKPRHLDFLLYDHETTAPVLALELDDVSHDAPERRERDAFVDEALLVAGVVLVRVKAAASYNARELGRVLWVYTRLRVKQRRTKSR
jgi:hypothetical protein